MGGSLSKWAARCAAPTAGDGPGALAEKSQAQERDRNSGNFCRARAQRPGGNLGTHSDFARRKGVVTSRGNPRNGGPGESGPMGTKCPSAASPGDSLVTFSSLRKSLAARRRRSPCVQRIQSEPCPPIRPSVRTGAPSPQGEGFWGVGPQGEGLRGTERFPQFLNTKTPVPER